MSFQVIGVGEILWDLMPAGRQLGGAPANFAYHAHALGARAKLITRVGRDDLGGEILRRLDEMKIGEGMVQVDEVKPTGTVSVTLDDGGVPQFIIHEDVAWDHLALNDVARTAVHEADAVCFGTLAQRNPISRLTIQQLVAAAPAKAIRIFDINLREPFYSGEIIEQSLRLAGVLKLNDAELSILAKMFGLGQSQREQVQQLAGMFELHLVALTRGPAGSLLFQEGRWSEQLPQTVQVVDTVGAGDAFTATLSMGLLEKMDLDEVHSLAAQVAGYVCSQAGATPELPQQFRNRFSSST